ncbi:MAG: alpha/beta fold hydrolase [Bacteroidales bacterium]|nr:alpha/beta fold hydrolase [Bacteroidales bacterium]
MRIKTIISLTLLLMMQWSCFSQQIIDPEVSELQLMAQKFVNLLDQQKFESATETFDTTMTNAMPAAELQKMWKTITTQAGSFKKQIGMRSQKTGNYNIILVTCEFALAKLDVKVVYDQAKKMAGLFFLPYQPDFSFTAPPYADTTSFIEKDVIVGDGKWKLPATLTMPKTDGSHPAVVLVHGSGPNDRDETIGPNKPFRDLAWGLASKGIAVLRYDKRTRIYGSDSIWLGDYTIEDEVITDALAAIHMLKTRDGIDQNRIYVLGHSLGAMMAPMIGERDPDINGLIIMAGPGRPMEDLIAEQYNYLLRLDDTLTTDENDVLQDILNKVEQVKNLNPDANEAPGDLPLGLPVSYWLSLKDYHPAQVAAKLKTPMLILQGERDYQVTMTDFKIWQEQLSGRNNISFISYPSLTHLFMTGTGKPDPAEYQKPQHVDQKVISDITDWIN